MKSIYTKLITVMLFWLILSSLFFSAISIFIVNRITEYNSTSLLTQACEKEALRFNKELELLENSVTTVKDYILSMSRMLETESDICEDEFCSKVEELTVNIANRTSSAMAVYFRYDPELVGSGTKGFFWSRSDDSEVFSQAVPTDILAYDKEDLEHVGWFYQPKNEGKAIWMSPYYNKNLDVYMISYIVPIVSESGTFIGIVGMDIDFDKIIQLTEKVVLYESGQTKLLDLSAYLIFDSDENGNVRESAFLPSQYNDFVALYQDETQQLIETKVNGSSYLSCYSSLTNGMHLLLYVPTSEIYAYRAKLIRLCLLLTIVFIICAVLVILKTTDKIVHPLRDLTKITGQYAKGNWDETYDCKTGDEIQTLSESISIMASTTRSYIDQINENSQKDGLTGLKNKKCYLSYIERYKNPLRTMHTQYAIIVFDINYLKRVNDQYGHEYGDQLIIAAGQLICDIFSHSPVFRVGGDEYIVLMERKDYLMRKNLCREFMDKMEYPEVFIKDVPLSVSYGMASCPADGESFEELFRLADQRMYQNKKEMKGNRE